MNLEELRFHLLDDHNMKILVKVVNPNDEEYLRGFHDGLHGRIGADDIDHPHESADL